MPLRSPALRSLLLALLLALALSATAGADVREIVVHDPRDAPERLDSGPRAPDLEYLRLAYDSSGTFAATIRLWEPWPQTDRSLDQVDVRFGTQLWEGEEGEDDFCTDIFDGDAFIGGSFDVDDPYGSSEGFLMIKGLEGSVRATRSMSPDGRELTYVASTPHGANRPYACASFRLQKLVTGCSGIFCRSNYHIAEDTTRRFAVPRAAPPPPAPKPPKPVTVCGNGADDDGDGAIDTADPGCRGRRGGGDERDPAPVRARFRFTDFTVERSCKLLVGVEVSPALGPARVFPFRPVELTVRRQGGGRAQRVTRRLQLGNHGGYEFRLRPGRYRVSGRYVGDRFRLRSPVAARTVTVANCRPRR